MGDGLKNPMSMAAGTNKRKIPIPIIQPLFGEFDL